MRILFIPADTTEDSEASLEFKDIPFRAMASLLKADDLWVVRLNPELKIKDKLIMMVADDRVAARGKIKPTNWGASALYGTQSHGDYIYGDALLVAANRDDFIDFPDMPLEAARAALSRHVISHSIR